MTKDELLKLPEEQVKGFIRKSLALSEDVVFELNKIIDHTSFHNTHIRFDMSGYDSKTHGSCTIHNANVLNTFAYLGLYDHTQYLVIDFYKGMGTLFYRYWGEDANLTEDYGGEGSIDIIYDILKKTIFSGKSVRRRY